MALYREYDPIIDGEKTECLFTDRLYNEDIALTNIAWIEDFYRKNGYIDIKYVELLLNYVAAYSRRGVCMGIDSPLTSSMTGRCATAANICHELLTKMGFNPSVFNVKDLINEKDEIHELCKLTIPVKVNDQIINKEFILDPTFKQFCLKQDCTIDKYNGEKRFQFHKATPSPGYFLNLTEEGKNFATSLLYYGYFETTDQLLKMYGDAFKLFTIESNEYNDPSLVGKVSNLNIDVNYYRNNLNNTIDKSSKLAHLIIKSPLVIYLEKTKKNIKNFINKNRNNEYLNSTNAPEIDRHYGR